MTEADQIRMKIVALRRALRKYETEPAMWESRRARQLRERLREKEEQLRAIEEGR